MKVYSSFYLIIVILFFSQCQNSKISKPHYFDYSLELIDSSPVPLIDKNSPGSESNTKGYEGGTVFMNGGIFQMFVTEEINGWVNTRTGYWKSEDGEHWKRVTTILESVDKANDPKNAVWAAMPFYNKNEDRWNLFYVGYERDGVTNGRIFRAVASKQGEDGLAGPYIDVPGTVLSYEDANKDPWEGSQGAAAFYAYQVGSKWFAFYASGNSKSRWDEGIITADSLEGKWTRDDTPNPVLTYSENPIVNQLKDGTFFCVFDDIAHGESSSTIGYGYSLDGVYWRQKFFTIPMPSWAINIRTPQGMVPAGKDTYWIYFTANTASGFDCIGRIKVKINESLFDN